MQARTFTVGTGAQLILGPGDYGAILQADSANTADIYLGGESVTADGSVTGGFRLAAGQSLPIEVDGGEYLFAISGSAGQVLRTITGDRRSELELG